MKKQTYNSAVSWKGERCDVSHYEVSSFSDIPDTYATKAHGVCFCKDKLLVVYHSDWNIWGIPGGSREQGETVYETLEREVREESACNIINAQPIAYQQILHSSGGFYYALFYHCDVVSEEDFIEDIGGSITKVLWIDPERYTDYIEEKPFRRAVIESALRFRSKI